MRKTRNDEQLIAELPALWRKSIVDFPDDWLLSLEILEILDPHSNYKLHCDAIELYLDDKRGSQPHLEKLIANGIKMVKTEKTESGTQHVGV